MSATWDGVTTADALKPKYVAARHALADAARDFKWDDVFAVLDQNWVRVNAWRLDGKSWYAPLHQAAYGNAPLLIVEQLLARGAWRSLPTATGERPVDIARRKGHTKLYRILQPVYKHDVPPEVLAKVQTHFHTMVRERASQLIEKYALRLPELSVMLELETPDMSFPVPGMYGGFYYRLVAPGAEAKLVCESWSRVVGGSGQRHEITADGCTLVAEGFV